MLFVHCMFVKRATGFGGVFLITCTSTLLLKAVLHEIQHLIISCFLNAMGVWVLPQKRPLVL